MSYNMFGGTLNLAESVSQWEESFCRYFRLREEQVWQNYCLEVWPQNCWHAIVMTRG